MRYLIIVKANAVSEAGTLPDPGLLARRAAYHDGLAKAGVLLDANGLRPTADGFRIRYADGRPVEVLDGPFTGTKELFAGYTLIEVRSRDEALEWARRHPAPFDASMPSEIEVRRVFELEDVPPGPAISAFRAIPPRA